MPPKRKTQAKIISVPDLNPGVARQLIQAHQDGQELREDQVLWLANLDAPLCGGSCKVNDKNNPNCFCCLAPAENSFKKKGLWKKEPDELLKLGADPSDSRREDSTQPCGLSNLGNTCYVNSALQCLFMVPSFRWGLYRVPAPVAEQEIMAQLRHLFLALDYGPRKVVDPTVFANCLNLNHAIQQDGQEFFKLLLTKVQDLLAKCSDQALASLVARLFRGRFSYITVCKECGQASSSSSVATDFYELPLQVKGCPTLMDSMVSALSAEILEKDNQYACDICCKKTDASRQQVLRQLPPYMCMQLQRFVFDYNKMDKMKVSDKFSFPLTLDMPTLLASVAPDHDQGVATEDAAGGPAGSYELTAVLIHKGTSASHGHYVAHIKDSSGTWWRFDDETVTPMGPLPTSHPGDHGTAATPATGKAATQSKPSGSKGKAAPKRKGKAPGRGRKRSAADAVVSSDEEDAPVIATSDEDEVMVEADDEVIDVSSPAAKTQRAGAAARGGRGKRGRGRGRGRGSGRGDPGGGDAEMEGVEEDAEQQQAGGAGEQPGVDQAGSSAAPESITSANAYMLLYRQMLSLAQLKGSTCAEGVGWSEQGDAGRGPEQLPSGPRKAVEEMLSAFEIDNMRFADQKREAELRVEERRAAVRAMLACAPVDPPHAPGGLLVPSPWLEAWCLEAEPPAWDAASLMCPHNQVDPAKSASLKRVSEAAWSLLHGPQPLSPALPAPAAVCRQCILAQLRHLVGTDSSEDVRKELEALLSPREGEVEVLDLTDSETYLISKTWLAGWLKRRVSSMNTESSPTTAITCPHGALLPKASTIAIPDHLWRSLKHLWQEAVHWQAAHGSPAAAAPAQRSTPDGAQQSRAADPEPSAPRDTASGDEVMLVSDSVDPPAANGHTDATGSDNGATHGGRGRGRARSSPSRGAPSCLDLPARTTRVCGVCEQTHGEAVAARSQLRQGLQGEKQLLPALALSVPADLQPGATYNLVPRAWLAQWRAYVTQGPRKPGALTAPGTPYSVPAAEVPRPGPLLPALAQLLCPCHRDSPHLRVPPPRVAARRSKYVQADPSTDELVLIQPEEWSHLCALYPPAHPLDVTHPTAGDSNGPEPVPLTDAVLSQLLHGFTAQLVLQHKAAPGAEQVAALPQTGLQEKAVDLTSPGNQDTGSNAAQLNQQPQAPEVAIAEAAELVAAMVAASEAQGRATRAGKRGATALQGPAEVTNAAAGSSRRRRVPAAPYWEGVGAGRSEAEAPGDWELLDHSRALRPALGPAPALVTHPPVCSDYVQQVREDTKRQQLTYESAEIMCELVGSKEELAGTWPAGAAGAGAAGPAPAVAERRSRRARRGRQPLTLSSWNTLGEMKMHIFQSFYVHPQNAQVYVRGVKLQGDDRTLAALEVFPGEEVRVINQGDADPADLDSVFPGSPAGRGKRREVETGFRDTALQSGATGRGAGAGTQGGQSADPDGDGDGSDGQAGPMDTAATGPGRHTGGARARRSGNGQLRPTPSGAG